MAEKLIYNLILRQSCIKQQSARSHWPFDFPKQGVQPSAIWIACISSVFFILPGVTPRALAFFLTSGILIHFSNTFTGGIFLILLHLWIIFLYPLFSFNFRAHVINLSFFLFRSFWHISLPLSLQSTSKGKKVQNGRYKKGGFVLKTNFLEV